MSYPVPTPQASTPPPPANFSVADGINVVIRCAATSTECLMFAGRKVTVCMATGAGWLFGGIKGTLRYAHENLGNRSVQPDQGHARTAPPQPGANPPLEAYVMYDAVMSADTLSRCVLTTHTEYPWLSGENLGSVAFTFLIPCCLLGPVGSVLLNLPRVCGVQPYVNFQTSPHGSTGNTHTQPEVTQMSQGYSGRHRGESSQPPSPALRLRPDK